MTREEVLAFIRERAKAWRSVRFLERDEAREMREMRAWASGAERIAADLAREWAEEAAR